MREPSELKIGGCYTAYQQPRATYECLKSFRLHYPEAPVYLVSDCGYDFSEIAQYFHCDYKYLTNQIWTEPKPYKFHEIYHIFLWLDVLKTAALKFSQVDWILFMEDDMRTRGRIKWVPPAPLAGPCICPYTPELKTFIQKKYPWIEIWGYSGCAGTILHRETFLRCLKNLPNFEEARKLDERVRYYSDALITYVFLYNGYENKPWLDQSETSCGRGRPDAAFDHQYKEFYDKPWDDSMIRI